VLSNEKIHQSAALSVLMDLLTNPSAVPAFIQFRLEFGETEVRPLKPLVITNLIDFDRF
jgi:hypothetical protein